MYQEHFSKSKHSINKTDMQQVKQNKSENYNYTNSKQATACVNDCSKVKLHGLVRPLNLIFPGMDLLDYLDQQISDQTYRSNHLTFNY